MVHHRWGEPFDNHPPPGQLTPPICSNSQADFHRFFMEFP
jgi:hypothetical protein